MHFSSFFSVAVIFGCNGLSMALPDHPGGLNAIRGSADKYSRSAGACADPSLTQTVFQAFGPALTVHALDWRYAFEHINTVNKASVWDNIQPSFRAWPTPQNFTVPLFQLVTEDLTQYIYRTSTDAQTPAVVSGFTAVALIGWVYDSQVCGSLPLMSANLPAFTDNYFTINEFERDRLVVAGRWIDTGTIAFVLPLNDS